MGIVVMRARKVDRNQAEIVAALRKAGYYVLDMHAVGGGFPDLLVVGKSRAVMLLEVKMPGEKLTSPEAAFMDGYPGRAVIVESAEQAIREIEYADSLYNALNWQQERS